MPHTKQDREAPAQRLGNAPRPQRLHTLDETSAVLRISRWSLYQLINSGRIRSVHIERRHFIPDEDLEAFLTDLRDDRSDHGR